MVRRINLSAAIIVLICFFLPWIQVSCGSASDAVSGFDLARDTRPLLWLAPTLMLAVVAMGLLRAWDEQPQLAAMVSVISGAVTALLMNRERVRARGSLSLISAQPTGWFWLALISSIAIVATAMTLLLQRRKT